MAAKQRKPEELREQSKHLLYEIQMLVALGRYFETGEVDAAVGGLDRAGLPVRNAVVEAFELHARQLIEFLTHQRNGRRATARDWSGGWSVPKGKMQELKKLRDAFSERVAHLSWKRSEFTPDQQLVIAHEIEGELRPLLLRFLAEAVPERLCEGFLEEARTALLDERGTDARAEPTGHIEIVPTTHTAGTATQALRG